MNEGQTFYVIVWAGSHTPKTFLKRFYVSQDSGGLAEYTHDLAEARRYDNTRQLLTELQYAQRSTGMINTGLSIATVTVKTSPIFVIEEVL